MTEGIPENADLLLKRALFAVKDLRSQLAASEQSRTEPIAVVGIGCRFPGGATPDDFWRVLGEGRDAVTEVPPDRWDVDALYDPDPDAPGKICSRFGAFVPGIDRFDPAFFGLSPREAARMDPQHRLLLEVSWEALEHAGIAPDKLFGTSTGVFVGLGTNEYASLLEVQGDPGDYSWIDSHAGLGNALSVAAGRISYVLGIQGPALVVDTACSSSLVAVHLACQSLRQVECDTALAAAASLIISPKLSINFSQSRMLAPDGRCKTFDAAADGYVRGEGCGVLVLRRLSDALAHGDRILALIRGSAVNQDGRSSGLTAPNGPAQEAAIRAALQRAGVDPRLVSYVEAHGTGTSLGDPIEARALARVFGPGRGADHQLWVGSVKTNIGHLEAAAGIAGLIKVILALQRRVIPAHLHFRTWNENIALDGSPLAIPTAAQPWEPIEDRRVAGVSSFGWSGTNSHVVLEEAPAIVHGPAADARPVHVLCLSAKDDGALREQVTRYHDHLAQCSEPLSLVCASAATGRSHFRHRVAIVAASIDEARRKLHVLGQADQVSPGLAPAPPKIAFLFTGQGSQYAGMGRALYEAHPVFRATLDQCAAILQSELTQPLTSILFDANAGLDDTLNAQPALFALEYALAELWRSWGVTPAAMLGHSLGEYVAACVAGVMSLEDALLLVARRARLMSELPRTGSMAAVFADERRVAGAIVAPPRIAGVAIAAVNGPANTVVSGDRTAVDLLLARLAREGVTARPLAVSHAFHSHLMEPALDAFETLARTISCAEPRIAIASNVTGEIARSFDAAYLRSHARQPVRFADGISTLVARGCRTFVEIGPRPVLAALGRECVDEAVWLPSLSQSDDDWNVMVSSVAQLYVMGAEIDWDAFEGPWRGRKVALPTYPFQRQSYWPERSDRVRTPFADEGAQHMLLGRKLRADLEPTVFEVRLDTTRQRFLGDHVVFDEIVVPGAQHLVTALAAAVETLGAGSWNVEDVVFAAPLTVPPGGCTAQLVLEPGDDDTFAFRLASLGDEGQWVRHASGMLRRGDDATDARGHTRIPVPAIQARCHRDETGPADLYTTLAARGIELGPAFRGIAELWRGDGEALARLRLPDALVTDANLLPIHPAQLDACLQTLAAVQAGAATEDGFLPFTLDRLRFHDRRAPVAWCHATMRNSNGGSAEVAVGDVSILDEAGGILIEIEGLAVKRASRDAMRRGSKESDWLYQVAWSPRPKAESPRLPAPHAIASELAAAVPAMRAAIGLDAIGDLGPALERLATAYAAAALRSLGWAMSPGTAIDEAELRATLGVTPRHERLLHRIGQMLAEDGILRQHDLRWEVLRTGPALDPEAMQSELADRFPACRLEIDLLGRCGRNLPDVLRGRRDPAQLLLPTDDGDNVYRDSPLAQILNRLVAGAFTSIVRGLPDGSRLRVLEIGAGTGGTTAAVLPLLPAGRVEYVYTDVARMLLAQAEPQFADFPFVRFQHLDIEKDPEEQGFAPRTFDVILAANVLHATADLRRTLATVKTLLAPGGVLVLLEAVKPRRFADMVFGLTEGWWKFSDNSLRPEHALLARDRWLSLLRECGFSDAHAVSEQDDGDQAVIVARGDARDAGRWLVLAGENGVGTRLCERLHASGADSHRVDPASTDRAALHQLLARERHSGVVYLGGLDAQVDARDAAEACRPALDVILEMAVTESPNLWIATRGAQPVDRPVTAPAAAPLWGLARVAVLEHPELGCKRVDLDPAATDDEAATALCNELLGSDEEDEIGYRGGERWTARLARADARGTTTATFASDATYLVSGGLGGLGLPLAFWMASQGARHFALLGRNIPSSAATDQIAALENMGASVRTFTADVSHRLELEDALRRVEAEMPPLRGVFHLAGALDDGVLLQQDWSRFARVFAAKVDGAFLLHALTLHLPLDAFVLFSTSTSLLGHPGQANHAAANAYLDALAHYRRSLSLPALCVNWGAWGEVGAVVDRKVGDEMLRQGMGLIPVAQGLATLGRLMTGPAAQVAVVPVNWERLLSGYAGRTVPRFLSDVARASVRPTAARVPRAAAFDLAGALSAAPPSERRARLSAFVGSQAAAVLRLDPSRPMEGDRPLNEIGLDSLMALELRNALSDAVGKKLPATLLFNYPSVAALTDFLARDVLALDAAPAPADTAADQAMSAGLDQIEGLSDQDLEDIIASELDTLLKESDS